MQVTRDKKRVEIKKGRGLIKGTVYSFIITAISLYLCAQLLLTALVTYEASEYLVIGSLFIGTALGSLITVKKGSSGVLVSGALIGSCVACTLLFCTLVSPGGDLGDMYIRLAITSVCAGLFGGALSLNRGKGNHRSAPNKSSRRR